jgi:hypothetical protein
VRPGLKRVIWNLFFFVLCCGVGVVRCSPRGKKLKCAGPFKTSTPIRATHFNSSDRMSSTYLPPHLRAAAAAKKAAEPPTPADLKSTTLFPSLGGVKHRVGPNLNVIREYERPALDFKQKINDLIAFEKQSEYEKEAAREAARALEGFVTLSLKINADFINRYNKNLARAMEIEKERDFLGYMPPQPLPPLPPSQNPDCDDEEYVVLSDDDSDSI